MPLPAVTENGDEITNVLANGTEILNTQVLEGTMNQKLERVTLQLSNYIDKWDLLIPLLERLNKAGERFVTLDCV